MKNQSKFTIFIILILISNYSFGQNQWYKRFVITPEVAIGTDLSTRSSRMRNNVGTINLDLDSPNTLYRIKAPFFYGICLGVKMNEYLIVETGFNKIDRGMEYRATSSTSGVEANKIHPIEQYALPLGIKLQKIFDGKIGIQFSVGAAISWHRSISNEQAREGHPTAEKIDFNLNINDPAVLYIRHNESISAFSLYTSIGMSYQFNKHVALQFNLRYDNQLYNSSAFVRQHLSAAYNNSPYRVYDFQFQTLFTTLGFAFTF